MANYVNNQSGDFSQDEILEFKNEIDQISEV